MKLKLIDAGKVRTLKREILIDGPGPFSLNLRVRMRLVPSTKKGIRFSISGSSRKMVVPAQIAMARAANGEHTTLISRGKSQVKGVEHILSALAGLGIDACDIELNAGQVPAPDASAHTFSRAIFEAGIVEVGSTKYELLVTDNIVFSDKHGSMALISPAEQTTISALIQFPDPIGEQYYRLVLTPANYLKHLSAARSFIRRSCDDEVWNICRKILPVLPQDITKSPVMVFRDGKWIVGPQDSRNLEPVKHKILDAIGDLSLVGYPLRGAVTLLRPGHDFNRRLASYLTKIVRDERSRPASSG